MIDDRASYEKARERQVVKANDLIQRSRFSLSSLQQKIVLYLISRITPNDEDFKTCEFSVAEFCKVIGIDSQSGDKYPEIKAAIKQIADKSLWVKMPNGKEVLLRWIDTAVIEPKKGTMKVKLSDSIKPYLLQLGGNFTKYELIYVLSLKSKYSIRLYELLKSVHFHELTIYRCQYSLDDLRRALGAEEYTQFKNFKQRALDVAVNEVNEKTEKNVSYTLVKEGRKVVSINLEISSKPCLEYLQLRSDLEKELGIAGLTIWEQAQEHDAQLADRE